jgi:hypothetical protein
VGGRLVVAFVPQLVEAHRREGDRRGQDRQGQQVGVVVREVAGGGEHQVGVVEQVGRGAEGLHHHPLVAADAAGRQHGVDDAALADRVGHRHDVGGALVVVGRQRLAGEGVAPRHEAHDLVLQQHRQVHAVGRFGPVADHHVQVALGQGALEIELRSEGLQRQAHARRLAADALDHRGHEHRRQVVGRADAELGAAGEGLEALRREGHAVDLGQRGAGVGEQGEGPLGGHHAALLAHQQRVAQDAAQALEGQADRRLGLVELQRGARRCVRRSAGRRCAAGGCRAGRRCVGSSWRARGCISKSI